MNIAIVDDLELDRAALFNILSRYATEKNEMFNISVFESGEALLEAYKPSLYHLIFLDIFMDGISGLQTAEKIRETDDDTKIIFLTTSNDAQAEAIHYHAYDYIRKEDQPAATHQVLDHFLHRHKPVADSFLSFYYERKNVRIMFGKIMSVVADGNNLIITATNNEEFKPRMTFSSVKNELLTDTRFIEILRGIIVNMNNISELSGGSCLLTDGRRFPVSVRRSRKIVSTWHDFLFEQARMEGRN